MTTISLFRQRGNLAWMRVFRVLIDGEPVGTIAENQTKDFQVEPGEHTLKLKCDWAGSPTLSIKALPGERTELTCRTSASGPWVVFLRPSRLIDVVPRDQQLPPLNSMRRELKVRIGLGGATWFVVGMCLGIAGAGTATSMGVLTAVFLIFSFATVPRRCGRRNLPK